MPLCTKGFTVGVERLDLSIAPGGPGLSTVEPGIEQTRGYGKYLAGKPELLEELSTTIDFDAAGAAHVTSALHKIGAVERPAELVNEIINKTALLVAVRASVMAKIAL